jgi:predicted signal transduction protein with EAL and GGDEF domain
MGSQHSVQNRIRVGEPSKNRGESVPVQFRQGNIVSVIEKALENSALDPERLELEVTESVLIQNTDVVLDQLTRLRRLGISIALDDFGTGYSSISYLLRFPFETVKIDRSFVVAMESEPKAAAIVNTIVSLGKTMGLTIAAEGAATQAQEQFLREAGCDQNKAICLGGRFRSQQPMRWQMPISKRTTTRALRRFFSTITMRLSANEVAKGMVRRVNARDKLRMKEKSASMYPAFRCRVFSWP